MPEEVFIPSQHHDDEKIADTVKLATRTGFPPMNQSGHSLHATGTQSYDWQTALDHRIAYANALQRIMEQLLAQAIRRGFKVYGFEERSAVGSDKPRPVPMSIMSVEVVPPEMENL